MKKVSLITVNYNHSYLTEELLRSLILTNQHPDLEIIVVDNGTLPDPTGAWKLKYPEVIFIRSETNLGFAGGNNLGIKKATGEYLFLVNNDTELPKGLTAALSEILDKNADVGIISPRINYFAQPKLVQYAGFTNMNWKTGRNKCIGKHEIDNGQFTQNAHETGYVHGAAMMVRRETVAKAGLMPEEFFLYYEEMEWCERIRRAGYQVWVAPSLVIYHKESVSVGANSALKEFYMTRNRILFIRENTSLTNQILFGIYYFLTVVPRNTFNYLINQRSDLMKAFFKGIWWHFKTPNSQL